MKSNYVNKNDTLEVSIDEIMGMNQDPSKRTIKTHAEGPSGTLPFTSEFLIQGTPRLRIHEGSLHMILYNNHHDVRKQAR